MPDQDVGSDLRDIKDTMRLLVMLEFCKEGATREQVRDVLGTVDNNLFAKVNAVVVKRKRKDARP